MKARLGAYAYWQLRDFVLERAAAIVIVSLLLVFASYESIGPGARRLIAAGGREALLFSARTIGDHLDFLWFVVVLIAVHGISANDRTTGRFRLLFAKPVPVLRYYAQAFAVHGIAFMVCMLIWLTVLSRLMPIGRQTAANAMVILGCCYLLVGGVGFLMSAIWRSDWITTTGVWGVTLYIASRFQGARWLDSLPPFWKISEQINLVKTLDPIETKPLLWVVAYGVACFLLGLIILKRRPLAT